MSEGIEDFNVKIPDKEKVLDVGDEASFDGAAVSKSLAAATAGRNLNWALHRHRQDPSVRYEARKTEDGYEVKHPDSPDDSSWTLDSESFEAIYEVYEEEEET